MDVSVDIMECVSQPDAFISQAAFSVLSDWLLKTDH